eukprot:3943356-Pyramimonas_sp.AAC.1
MFLEVKTQKATIAVGVCYFISCLGVAGENLSKMRGIAGFVRALGIPWMLVGDFNIEVETMWLSGYPQSVHARVLAPVGVDFTCSQGSGAMIDYALVSEDLAPFVQ